MRKQENQPAYPGFGIVKLSAGKEFAFELTLRAVARVVADSEAEARTKLGAIECVDMEKVDVSGLDGRLTEASLAHDTDAAELIEIDGDLPCRECGEPYEEGGDGWDGLCPSCADRASIILDAEEDDWMFVETDSGWYAEREVQRTQHFPEQIDAANFIQDNADLLDLPDIPGKPDIVFLGRKRAIFVHGCFWHGHDCARGARMPKTNAEYWSAKIGRNRVRDAKNRQRLEEAGWRALVIWECEMRDESAVSARLKSFLSAEESDAAGGLRLRP